MFVQVSIIQYFNLKMANDQQNPKSTGSSCLKQNFPELSMQLLLKTKKRTKHVLLTKAVNRVRNPGLTFNERFKSFIIVS